jgi:hypothetical protein
MFDCQQCGAEGRAHGTVTIVEHTPGCSLLADVVRRRWPLKNRLPDTPEPRPFQRRADWSRAGRR